MDQTAEFRAYKNSTAVRVTHRVPTDIFVDTLQDLHLAVLKQCEGDVATCPGPGSDQVDWLFEKSSDALWFMLKYSGEIVDDSIYSKLVITDE